MSTITRPKRDLKADERSNAMPNPATASLAHQLELVTLERDMLRQERDRVSGLVRALEQALQRVEQLEQRLQEAQRQPRQPPSPVLRPVKRGESMRPAIRALLQEHPEGLKRHQIEHALGVQKNLAETLSHMKRKQMIRSNRGLYVLVDHAETPSM